jgi:hypothetical protein
MAIEFVLYTPEWEPAVARFNRRMTEARAPADFGISERAGPPRQGPVHTAQYLAVEGEEVRGGVLLLEHPAYLNNARQPGGSARRETVINIQSPLSEGIINGKYAMVSIQLIRFALKRCRYVYVVGMGSETNPLPKLLKASGWNVRPVPFFFRILRAGRCLRELQPLRRKPALRLTALAAAWTGAGAIGLRMAQWPKVSAAGLRTVAATAADASDDAVWQEAEKRICFGVVRNSSTLPGYLAKQVMRYRVYQGDLPLGWFSLLVSPMHAHPYFGNLTVATLVDVVAVRPSDAGSFGLLAAERARAGGADLVVSNQLQAETQKGLRAAGFLSYGSNYLFASSKELSAAVEDATAMVSRQDGDGLTNLLPRPAN